MAELFDEGQYNEAAALYQRAAQGKSTPNAATFLRARIAMRQSPHEAPEILNGVRTTKNSADFARQQMLLGEASASTDDFLGADEHLTSALAVAESLGDQALLAEVGYHIGRRHVMTADASLAREGLALARTGKSLESRLDALHLESWILSREGRLREQARVLTELLGSIDPRSPRHMEHRARASQTLAAIARELFLPEALPLVERQLSGAAWAEPFMSALFQTTKSIAWAKALQGDYFNAFRFLKRSAEVAPDEAWRATVLCDRAYLARVRNEELWFRQELFDAAEIVERVDWESRQDESTIALLLLAELTAPLNAAQASSYLARFRGLGDIRNARSLIRRDRRFEALVAYSTGVVDLYLGNSKLATTRLGSALKIYDGIGYEWRTARCALRLFEATKKAPYLDVAEKGLQHYPNSWLAEELRGRRTAKPPIDLPPMQKRIFGYLCEGLSNEEIAMKLGRSKSTVANHAKAVLKTFGVSSRSALIADAMRRGLL